ncbi:(2Fe-2S)-binding protein [Singulisphaera sp. Ch08]|uniref:(2Fe-2S)-binding protein n=1 Tax=Singulisphaera sp. Ch08 TaxID=3120278 RepID=A0AAU7CNP4_9BACT
MSGIVREKIKQFVLTVNGKEYERTDARADELLIDFLHEECELTGTKFSCGVGACGSCKVAVQVTKDAPMVPVLACYARLKSVVGMYVTTVEGLEAQGNLHPLQKAFLEEHSFQCGYSTPGFLMAARILMNDLERSPVYRDRLDDVILEAIGGHICRCTGYLRYIKAIRRVILATPGLVITGTTPTITSTPSVISFQISKQSTNDLLPETLVGRFDDPEGGVEFVGDFDWSACRRAWVKVSPSSIRTGVRVRDLNLGMFFFQPYQPNEEDLDSLRFELTSAREIDSRQPLAAAAWGVPVPVSFRGEMSFGAMRVPVQANLLARLLSRTHMRLTSQEPLAVDMRDLAFPIESFSSEFGLNLSFIVQINVDVIVPYEVH